MGSNAAIPHDASLLLICGQICMQLVQALCLGCLPHAWAHPVLNVHTPRFRAQDSVVEVDMEEWENEENSPATAHARSAAHLSTERTSSRKRIEVDEFDEDYFLPAHTRPGWWGAKPYNTEEGVRRLQLAKHLKKSSGSIGAFLTTKKRRGSGIDDSKRPGHLYRRWRRWVAFWQIPKVKYMLHVISGVYLIIILILLLTGHRYGLPQPDFALVIDLKRVPIDVREGRSAVFETMFFIIFIARTAEEFEQLREDGFKSYWSQIWNRFDGTITVLFFTVLIMRIVTFWHFYDTARDTLELTVANLDAQQLSFMYAITRWTIALYAGGVVLLCTRSLEYVQFDPMYGESVHMFLTMAWQSRHVMILMLWLCIAFGIAFTAVLPDDRETGLPVTGVSGYTPFFIPLWMVVGIVRQPLSTRRHLPSPALVPSPATPALLSFPLLAHPEAGGSKPRSAGRHAGLDWKHPQPLLCPPVD